MKLVLISVLCMPAYSQADDDIDPAREEQTSVAIQSAKLLDGNLMERLIEQGYTMETIVSTDRRFDQVSIRLSNESSLDAYFANFFFKNGKVEIISGDGFKDTSEHWEHDQLSYCWFHPNDAQCIPQGHEG